MSFINRVRAWSQDPPKPIRLKFDVPAIAASGAQNYDEENVLRHYRRFQPFNFMFIRNMSAVNITVRLDYSPLKELEAISKGEATSSTIPFRSFNILNQSAVTGINADEITIWIERT